jgi:poly-gamma-glutamate capsule biosynthesis protein CapA/YwtB (metallophosphatase superfamily)
LLLTPTRLRHFCVNRARGDEARWLERMLNREGRALGTSVDLLPDETLALRWSA